MVTVSIKNSFFVVISILFLIVGLSGISRLHLRSELPVRWDSNRNQIRVIDVLSEDIATTGGLAKGDMLLKIDDYPIQSRREIDFVLDSHELTKKINVIAQRGDETFSTIISLVPRFSRRFILCNLLLGILFWLVGIFVFLRKSHEKPAQVFFWGSMMLAVSIMQNWPGYPVDAGILAYLQPVLYLVIYPAVPAFILHFTTIYPTEKSIVLRHKYLSYFIFIPCVIFIVLLERSYLLAIHLPSLSYYYYFFDCYNAFRIYLIFYLILSIGCFIHSYQFSRTKESRDKLRWILWGMCVGTFPFLFLWSIPLVLGIPPLIPEDVNYIALMIVPLSFGFSIIKYQALDIEIVINRSIVYAMVTGVIIAIYLMLVGVAGHLLQIMSPRPSSFFAIIFTLIAALLFSPLKSQIQKWVDITFYRVKYNYRLAVKDFGKAISSIQDQASLMDLIITKINNAIPIDKIALMRVSASKKIIKISASQGMSNNDLIDLQNEIHEIRNHIIFHNRPLTVKAGRTELSDLPQLPQNSVLKKIGIELIIPVHLQNNLVGVIIIGKKLSAARYSEEDLELMMTMANEGFMAVERIRLQENMIIERAEKEKLKELSDLKSEFVSHVSHELRTPLTSIQWSIENLLDGIPEPPTPKIKQYLEGIHDSSQHLSRMIENLLDVSRIEAGRIEIFIERLDFEDEVKKILDIMKPLAEKKNIRFKITQPESLWVRADRDRLRDILTNILDNAIKYSNDGDEVEVKIEKKMDMKKLKGQDKKMVSISVIDHGPGIPKEKQRAIFERFERIREDKATRKKGLGLGLHIVKKLVELQGGRIWVESAVGKGSAFIFVLPGG